MPRRAQPAEPNFELEVEVEALVMRLTDLIAEAMDETRTSRADLARRLGVSPAHITQTLSGQRNMTLRTVAEALFAMEYRLDAYAVPLQDEAEEVSDDEPVWQFTSPWGREASHALLQRPGWASPGPSTVSCRDDGETKESVDERCELLVA